MAARVARVAAQMKMELRRGLKTKRTKESRQGIDAPGGFSNLTF
jgi:hypothetical protein